MYIHQIWYQGVSQAPARYDAFRESWRANHPQDTFMTWDSQSIARLAHDHYPTFEALYHSLPLMIQKIDMAKVFIMHRHGGTYADMDSESLRPLDDFLLGFPGITASYVNTKWMEHLAMGVLKGYSNRRMINNGIMISPQPRHPFWIYYLERLRQEIGQPLRPRSLLEQMGGDSLYVMNTTGPLFWTECVNEWRSRHPSDIRVLHYSYLEPIFGMDPPHLQVPLPQSYVSHKHASSWCQQDIGMIRLYYRYLRPYWQLWAMVLCVLLFTMIT